MLKQATQEKPARISAVFPTETEAAPPFHYEHYSELHSKHKEQTVFTYIPRLRGKFNGETVNFDELPWEERFIIYERLMFGFVGNLTEEIERASAKLKYLKKVEKTQEKKVKKVMDSIESSPALKAEELRGVVSKKTFSALMLYVKYAGNNRESILKFFKNLEKRK